MTVNELKKAVIHLGFESDIEDSDVFLTSAERALNLMYQDRPVSKTVYVANNPPTVVFSAPEFQHEAGKEEVFSLKGKAYTFRVSGNGEFIIKNIDMTHNGVILRNEKFNSPMQTVKGFINGTEKIIFKGNYGYTVSGFATYSAVKSPDIEDIFEFSGTRKIDLKKLFPDFISPKGQPKDKNGRILTDSTIKDGILILPFESSGEITLTYNRSPHPIKSTEENAEIDCPKETEQLLPLLTSSFIWLDDDTEKAQYYMSIYRDEIANIRRYTGLGIDTSYHTNGWA